MKELFEKLRGECLSGVWAQGVKLAREAGAVVLERKSAEELVLRVRAPGRAAYSTAVLYPADAEWTCDCAGPSDPCQHAAAAAIAANQAEQRGEPLARAEDSGGQLVYVLVRHPNGELGLERYAATGAGRTRIEGTLAGAREKHSLSPGPGDLRVDQILTAAARGVLRAAIWQALLEALSGARVELDGRPVRVQAEALPPVARVFDEGNDVVLLIEKNPELSELLAPGLARAGDVLRPLELMELTGMKLEHLPLKRRFSQTELGVLMTEVLPGIEAKLRVSIESDRLPRRGRERIAPRISFELGSDAHALSVLPLLVYGDPVRARIDSGRLVHLEGTLPERDEPAERRLIERLRDELNLVPGRRVGFDGQEANRFASRLRQFQSALGDRSQSSFVREAALVPRVMIEGDSLSVEFRCAASAGGAHDPQGTGERVSAEAVIRAWQDGLSLVPLAGGQWAPLPVDWLERYGDRILDLLAARDAEGRVAKAAVFALARLCDDLEQPRPPSFAELEPLVRDFRELPRATLPGDLAASLRDYQRSGVDWLCFLRALGLGAVLADDMGLGKTLQTLCAVEGRTLVVCPKSVLYNWQAEARRFRPALRAALYHGPERELDRTADLTLTTYAVLRLDAERLAAERWDTVVLDEAQAIKNPDSQVSRAAFELPARFRIALSGTPLENRLEELWSIFHFANRGLLGGRTQFHERYAVPAEQGNAEKLGELRERTRPFVLRRLKRDVLPELPPRTEMTLEIELEPRERELYSAVHAATRREVLERLDQDKNTFSALEALLRLRQAACHPALLPGQSATTSSKVVALTEALEQAAAEGHKAVVFSQWTSLLDLVEPHLATAGIAFTRLDGSTRDRAAVVGEFQASAGPPVLLASLKAGGVGLNLTAADHVFLLDPWWNPTVEDQAADRAHRIGQERPVLVYRLIARDTVEQGILALQAKKRALAGAALEGGSAAGRLTREDLLALLA